MNNNLVEEIVEVENGVNIMLLNVYGISLLFQLLTLNILFHRYFPSLEHIIDLTLSSILLQTNAHA